MAYRFLAIFLLCGLSFSQSIPPSGGGGRGPTGPTGPTGPAGATGPAGLNVSCLDATGSTTAYTCPSPTNPPAALAAGLTVVFVPQATNSTTGPTLAVNSLTAKTIKLTAAVSLSVGYLIAGKPYLLSYDGAEFILPSYATPSPNTVNDLTASRVLGTVYQNTGTKALFISVWGHTSVTDQLHAAVNSFNPPTDLVAVNQYPNVGNSQVFFIVLPGYYYSVDFFSGTKVVLGWWEWT